jgi:hypothetical protein
MPTATLPDFVVTPAYTNLVATIAGAGGVKVLIQNIDQYDVSVVAQASGSAPTDRQGVILRPREVFEFEAAQLWVRAFGPSGRVSVTAL